MSRKNYAEIIQIGDVTKITKKMLKEIMPIEYERLQTLPDNYTEGVSDSARYTAIGNGWTVDIIAHILSFLPDEYFEGR